MTSDRDTRFGFAPPHDEPIPYRERVQTYYQVLGYGAPYEWAHYAEVPFSPLAKPLAECRVALITTAAPYQPDKGEQGPGAPLNAAAKFYKVYSGDTAKNHLGNRADVMRRTLPLVTILLLAFAPALAHSQVAEKVVDIPTRPGIIERAVVLAPQSPKATVILFAGGHGGLQIGSGGSFGWGEGNFLVRTRQLFAEQGLLTIVVDAPSDRQKPPYLGGFRQTPEHVADIKAVIAWARQQASVPVWLVGTSRGTQSAAFIATQISGPDAPDGLVLTSTMLSDDVGRPVPAMPLDRVKVPVLVVHHEQDGCKHCGFSQIPGLMEKLGGAPRTQMIAFKGGQARGDPCEAFAYHGFNGIERDVVAQIAGWITAK